MKNISIIIPIFNSEEHLEILFQALQNNHFYKGDEVLLVDNGSTDNSILYCEKMVNQYPEIYTLLKYTEKAGSYSARNYGVSFAKGDIFVFTDSDTKPVKNWLDTIRNNSKEGVVLAGRITLDIINNTLWENFDNIAHLNSEKNAKSNCVATANMAVRKEDFFKVGLFEERFSGGDYEWSMRASDKGLKIQFLDQAIVHHPTRKSFDQILKKEQRIAYGAGNHYRNINKSLLTLFAIYLIKIFKIDTNIRYSRELLNSGVSGKNIIFFNFKFMYIRFQQLLYAIKGYKMRNVRKIGIK